MNSKEGIQRIRTALRGELQKRHGEIRQVEEAISRSEGYLRSFCRGKSSLTVELLMQSLEVMGVDLRLFFANALAAPLRSDAVLQNLRTSGRVHRGLPELKEAVRRVEQGGPLVAEGEAPGCVEQLLACIATPNGSEERRRLKTAHKYRDVGFVRAYLELQDSLRYDQPKKAGLNARTVAVHLLPKTPSDPRDRLALQIEALGIYGSARRMVGDFATAQRVLVLALEVARKHEFLELTASLLQRGSYILTDHGKLAESLALLSEALLIYFDLDSKTSIGSVLVDRGIVLHYQGADRAAVSVLEKALPLLDTDSVRISRNQLAAYQVLSFAYQNAGNFERAKKVLRQATEEFKETDSLILAKLHWQHGCLALAQGKYEAAEERLTYAFDLFEQREASSRALISLDLTKVLLRQGRTKEAVDTAMGMAQFLTSFRQNALAEAAIAGFVQAAMSGQLSAASIEELQKKLKPRQRARISTSRG